MTTTDTPKRESRDKSIWVGLTVSERDYIRHMAENERREIAQVVRVACDEYGKAHGYGPMPNPGIIRGRPPRVEEEAVEILDTDETGDTDAPEDN